MRHVTDRKVASSSGRVGLAGSSTPPLGRPFANCCTVVECRFEGVDTGQCCFPVLGSAAVKAAVRLVWASLSSVPNQARRDGMAANYTSRNQMVLRFLDPYPILYIER